MLDVSACLHHDSKISLYQQLYLFMRQEIESGRIAAGTQLPSIRRLTDSLHISKTTVEEAYQQLIAEGYIVSRARRGYFSLPQEGPLVEEVIHVPQADNSSIFVKPNDRKIDIDFHPAQVDKEHFPRNIWRKLTNEHWNQCGSDSLDYGDFQGELGLRTEIARYLRYSRGVTCTPSQIIIGSGIQYSIYLLSGLLRTQMNAVAMEDPGYHRVRSVFERVGVPIHSIPLEKDGIRLDMLRNSTANVVYVTPSHQFPLGMVMPYSKRIQLLQWAKEVNALILEDDYDGEFRYSEKPIPSLQGLDVNESVIYIGTFSKSFFPAIRMNYMVLPPAIHTQFLNRYQREDSPVPRIQQVVMEQFMSGGHWEKHIRRMRRVYRNKHALLLQTIYSVMKEKVKIIGFGAGLHVMLHLDTELSETELIERAESVGVKVHSLSHTWVHQPIRYPVICLGFGGIRVWEIEEGIKRLNGCWFGHF